MGLKLKELQKVVKKVVREEKNSKALCEEITKVLGPTIVSSHGVETMSRSANERLDILEALDRRVGSARPSILVKFVHSDSAETRKLVARLLPEHFLKMLMNDPAPSVRAAVARRLPLRLVEDMCRSFPKDDNLYSIKSSKKLLESGLPTPKVDDEEFDMYGDEPMGDMVGELDMPDLTEAWYDSQAQKLCSFYGGNIEGHWEEIAVRRFCDSMASMGVEVDEEKLMDAVYQVLADRDEAALEEGFLKRVSSSLLAESMEVMPVISEDIDIVDEMSSLAGSNYIEKFEEVFSVEHSKSQNPSYLAGINEGVRVVTHPSAATSPHRVVTVSDERAIDSYVRAWNSREHLSGNDTYSLKWSHDPETINMVNFHLELK